MRLDKGRLPVGADADITVLDPDRLTTITPENFHSKCRNTPFNGWTLRGTAVMTIVGGRVVHDAR
jgi:dihydroorotase